MPAEELSECLHAYEHEKAGAVTRTTPFPDRMITAGLGADIVQRRFRSRGCAATATESTTPLHTVAPSPAVIIRSGTVWSGSQPRPARSRRHSGTF